MMRHGRRRALRGLATLCVLGGASTGCATILYPERRGNRRGRIDVAPLILDILWFIPGIVPGVIALAVDFGSGAIYIEDKEAAAEPQSAKTLGLVLGEHIGIAAPAIAADAQIDVRLVTADGRVLDRTTGIWGSDSAERLALELPRQGVLPGAPGRLELVATMPDGTARSASHPLRLGIESMA